MTKLSAKVMILAAAFAVTAPTPAFAQTGHTRCVPSLSKRDSSAAKAAAGSSCLVLATLLLPPAHEQIVLNALLDQTPPRDLQTRAASQPGSAGAPSQGDAVPSVQPVAAASASIAAVGTGGGDNAITAISLNPSIFLGQAKDQLSGAAR